MDEDSVVVGIAARLNPVKDMSTLIRGFAEGHAAPAPGCGWSSPETARSGRSWRALAKELGVEKEVTFAGWISGGMDRFYCRAGHQCPDLPLRDLPLCPDGGRPVPPGHRGHRRGRHPLSHRPRCKRLPLLPPETGRRLGQHLAALGQDDALRHDMGERLL